MLRTITLGSCVSVQGLVVGHSPDGRLVVRVDEKLFTGHPVPQGPGSRPAAAPAGA